MLPQSTFEPRVDLTDMLQNVIVDVTKGAELSHTQPDWGQKVS